ncbi:MAG: DNA replication/repair protein RecF [Firmicutes bacterium]|nr:DNA replication/repair protein RecF [Bacillota bacterium]
MKITKINLINFRNYDSVSLKLGENMNIFIGDNAQGKTNILESIVILALTKTHRVGVSPNIIKFNKKKAKISGVVRKDKIITKLGVEITEDKKIQQVNNKEIRKVSDYISNLNVIVFTPDDLDIIKGSPNIRRNLLNIELSQMSKIYLNTYNEYNKLLKTRNEYLKILFNNSIADVNYLDIITDKLIEKAIIIYQKRKEFIDMINDSIDNYYKEISNDSGLRVEYVPNIDIDDYEYENLRKKLKHTYKKKYKKELNYGMTLYGPHRDDFNFILNANNLKFFGSQGQQKVAILAYKLSEIPIFKNMCNTSPILLLDDIFSELDVKKRNKLLKLVSNDLQSIITTTDLRSINKKYLEDAYIYTVKNGNIERK